MNDGAQLLDASDLEDDDKSAKKRGLSPEFKEKAKKAIVVGSTALSVAGAFQSLFEMVVFLGGTAGSYVLARRIQAKREEDEAQRMFEEASQYAVPLVPLEEFKTPSR